jgi:hypothetical protein
MDISTLENSFILMGIDDFRFWGCRRRQRVNKTTSYIETNHMILITTYFLQQVNMSQCHGDWSIFLFLA